MKSQKHFQPNRFKHEGVRINQGGKVDFETNAIEMEGDTIVGLGYDVFRDPADNRLRVLISGTVVKFR